LINSKFISCLPPSEVGLDRITLSLVFSFMCSIVCLLDLIYHMLTSLTLLWLVGCMFGRIVNSTLLVVSLIYIIPNKTGMNKVFFFESSDIGMNKTKKFVNLSGMNMSKEFSLPVIH
jgi:hypothetical protein